jgi:hypothetical protein
LSKIADLQNEIEETYLESKITNLGISLGYEPNLNNALRIISNNIQTFLILLDLVGKGAVNQLKSNKIRSLTQVKNGEHSVEFNRKRLTPFPNYYKKSIQSVSGKRLETNTQEYPGSEFINSDWFEVQFIEEIYNAVEEIKKNSDEGKTKSNTVEQKDTNILTLFQLGQEDLTNYVKDDYTLILGELMSKFGLLNSYSGLLYRGLKNTTSNIIPKLANFEMSLIRKEVFNRLSNDESRFVLGNEIQIATKSETINDINYTNLGNFGINFLGFRTKKTNDTSNKTPEEAYRILKSEYSKLNVFLSQYQPNNYTTALNNFKKVIINSVDKKDVYNLLSYDNIDNINLYSLTGDRNKELNHLVDLKSNFNYYSTPNINEELIGLTDEYTQIDETKSNSNVYQGFYSQLNDNLTKVNTEIDLGRSVSYGLEGVNALTFNTITEDYANLDSRKPFTLVTPIGVNHDIIFNQL